MYIDEKRGYLVIGIRGEYRKACGRKILCDISCRITVQECHGKMWTNALIDYDPNEDITESFVKAIRKELRSICK